MSSTGLLTVWLVVAYVHEHACKLGNFSFLRNHIFVPAMGVLSYGVSRLLNLCICNPDVSFRIIRIFGLLGEYKYFA